MLRPLLLSLAFNDVVPVVLGAVIAPTITTEASEPTIVRRDEEIPTITMGNMAQYYNYEGDDTVEKRSVAIFPTGLIDEVPGDGVHVVFGPDMQSDMEKVLNDKCKDQQNMQECQSALAKLLQESSLNLHTKRFILIAAFTVAEIFSNLVAAAVGAVAGAGIGAGINALKAPPSVNFADTGNYGALAQLNAHKNATAIAIATGSDDKIMATISVAGPASAPTPTSAPNEGVQIVEITQDNGDEHKGDIQIKIPKDTASRLLDYLGMWGLEDVKQTCKASQRRRRGRSTVKPRAPPTLSPACQRRIAQLSGATLTALNDVLMQLIPTNTNNPLNPANHADGALVPAINVGEIPMVTLLMREWFGESTPGADAFNEFMMRAAMIVKIVEGAALDGVEIATDWLKIEMLADEMAKVQVEDVLKCSQDLVCVDDNCKGTVKLGPTFPIFQGKELYQTGFCTEGENNGCFCEEVVDPWIYKVEDDSYYDALQQWVKDLSEPGPEASCDSSNKINVDPRKFKDRIGKACGDHQELKKRGELGKRGSSGWDWDQVDPEHFQWSFDWNDQSEQCDVSCQDMFEIFEDDEKCVWNDGMSKSGFVKTECGIASYSVDSPNPATCWPYEFGAPRGKTEIDHEGGAGTSVEDALEQFCNDIDGQQVKPDTEHSRRWGFSEWGVKDRRSFWLRAQYAPRDGCQGYEWPHKTNCKAVFKQAMEQCAPGQGRTNGFIVPGIGCMDYSIHVTDDVHDENPPWNAATPMWPASYSAPAKNGGYNKPKCSGSGPSRPLSDDDLNKAIDAFCQDGADIKGYGQYWKNMFDYPPSGQPQFYNDDRYWYHLTMGAATVNQGDPDPYKDMNWCKDYDWKLGKDDCTYALRKLHHDCRNDKGELLGGDFTYRCVHYKSWGVNMQNCNKSPC